MVSKSIRKQLIEHNWLWIQKQDSNPSQTWLRLKEQSITAINDLTLLAYKLPEDKLEKIFSPNRVEDLIVQIIYIGFFTQSNENFNSRKSEIATRLIKRGIDLLTSQYVNSSPDTPSLIKPVLEHLRQTVDICNDISYKMKLHNINEEIQGSEYQYLFSWKNMYTKEENSLISFILSKTRDFVTDILTVQDKKNNRRVISFGIDTGDSEIVAQGMFQIAINNTHTCAEACIFDHHNQIIWKDELLVKEVVKDTSLTWRNNLSRNPTKELDDGNDFNFYIKKNDSSKKRIKLK